MTLFEWKNKIPCKMHVRVNCYHAHALISFSLSITGTVVDCVPILCVRKEASHCTLPALSGKRHIASNITHWQQNIISYLSFLIFFHRCCYCCCCYSRAFFLICLHLIWLYVLIIRICMREADEILEHENYIQLLFVRRFILRSNYCSSKEAIQHMD